MADVPDQLVLRRVEDRVDRHRQLDHPEPRAEVPAGHADRRDRLGAQLVGHLRAARRSTAPSGPPAVRSGRAAASSGAGRSSSSPPGPSAVPREDELRRAAAGSPPPSRRARGCRTRSPTKLTRLRRAPVEPEQRHEGRLAARLVLAQPLARRLGVALDVEDVVADLEGEPERRRVAPQRLGVRPPEDRARLRRPDEERAGLQRLQVGDRRRGRAAPARSRPRCRAPGRRPCPPRPPPAPAAGSAAPAAAGRCRPAARRGPRRPAPAARRRPAPPSPRPTSRAPSAGRGAASSSSMHGRSSCTRL